MHSVPFVSVIIPTYNYATYIVDAINSILSQSYPREQIEIIVVDDGSSDNTKDVMKSYIDNNTIKYYYQQNKGKANATFKAIQKSTGKYIFNLDADDYYFADKISRSVSVFESDPEIVHVASPAKAVFPDTGKSYIEQLPVDIVGITLDGKELLKRFMNSNMLYGSGSTYAARSSVLKAINIPDAVDMYIDEFLILAVLPLGKSFIIEQPLSVWRGHTSNYSGNNSNKKIKLMKSQRLLNSSTGILSYLQENGFDQGIVKIYRLKDLTRRIAFKEIWGSKTVSDIYTYAKEVFFQLKPGWRPIAKYNVINRLIPTNLFRLIKKVKNFPIL